MHKEVNIISIKLNQLMKSMEINPPKFFQAFLQSYQKALSGQTFTKVQNAQLRRRTKNGLYIFHRRNICPCLHTNNRVSIFFHDFFLLQFVRSGIRQKKKRTGIYQASFQVRLISQENWKPLPFSLVLISIFVLSLIPILNIGVAVFINGEDVEVVLKKL